MSEDLASDQLIQLFKHTTWDGNLVDKTSRDSLIRRGFASKVGHGWNFITASGIKCLEDLGKEKEMHDKLHFLFEYNQ